VGGAWAAIVRDMGGVEMGGGGGDVDGKWRGCTASECKGSLSKVFP
jgi:hypothetical protein